MPNLIEAAILVADENLPIPPYSLAEWARPSEVVRKRAVKAGWPIQRQQVRVSHPESVDSRGWHRPARTDIQEVVMLPIAWLRRLAEVNECEYAGLLGGEVG